MQGLRTVYEVERESLASHACRAKGRDKFSPFLLFYPFHGHEYAGFYYVVTVPCHRRKSTDLRRYEKKHNIDRSTRNEIRIRASIANGLFGQDRWEIGQERRRFV